MSLLSDTYLNKLLVVNCRTAVSPDIRSPQLILELKVVYGILSLEILWARGLSMAIVVGFVLCDDVI